MKKKKKELPKILTRTESDAFRSVIGKVRDRVAIALMLDGGLRVSEATELKLQNIIWEERLLRFEGKGGTEAEVPISNRLRDELERALKARPPQATHAFVLWNIKNPSQSISRFALNKMIRVYKQKAGIQKRVHPHMLRHTFGTELYRATGDLGKVQKALRHDDPQTTTIYVHLVADYLREDFEAIDRRPWIIRFFSRLKPHVIPELLKPKPKPFYIGETIGREKEITQLRKNLRAGMNTAIIGDRGTGRKYLLKQLEGDGIYLTDTITPPKENLVSLCEKLMEDGLIEEMPKGRSTTPFIDAVREIGKSGKYTLVISSLNDIGRNEMRVLRKIAQHWTIFSSIDRNQKPKLDQLFFGNYEAIELENLDKKETFELARKAAADINIPDMKAFLNHIYTQSQGNPQAIIEIIEKTKKTGNLSPEHSGMQKVLPATPFLSLFVMAVVLSRYSASALSKPSLKIYAIVILLGLAPLIILDKILNQKAK